MSDKAGKADNLDEFLGTEPAPRWKRWAKFWVPAVILILVLLLVGRCVGGGNGVNYLTEDVTTGSLDLEVTATGNLRPTNQVEVGSEVSGRIDEVYVDVNDRVTRGQVLARINTDVIDADIKQSRASLQTAIASVSEAKATLDYNQAQLARLQDVFKLSGGKVPSRREMQSAEADVSRAKASLASAQASVSSAQAQLSSSQTNRNRAIIVSPVSGIVLTRDVEPGQTVAASFSTPTLFVIAEDLEQMQLRVEVDEADVGQVKDGQKATFSVDAYPGKAFPAVVERVDLASTDTANTDDSAASSSSVVVYEARLTVDNSDGLLRAGMTATATISTENTGEAMLVPNGALRFEPETGAGDEGSSIQLGGGPGQFGLEREERQATIGAGSKQSVYVLADNGKLSKIMVTTGQSDGKQTVVVSDELKAGMKVVTGVKAAE